MVVGGAALRQDRVKEINNTIDALKAKVGAVGELKWKKYRGGNRRALHEGLVDYSALLIREQQMHLHFVVCRFSEFDHKISGPGTPEKSVNRMYFQLFLHRVCRFYGKSCAIYAFPDAGNDSSEIVGFREVVCARAYNTHKTRPNCLRSIQPQDSRLHPIMQMVDVLVGAVAAKRENRALSDHKAALADYVQAKLHPEGWQTDTARDARALTVWNFRHRP